MQLNNFIEIYNKYSRILIYITGFMVLVSLIAIIGFYLSNWWISFFQIVTDIAIYIFILNEIIKLIFANNFKIHIQERSLELIILVLLLSQMLFPQTTIHIFSIILPNITPQKISLIYLAIIELFLIFIMFLKLIRLTHTLSNIRLHSSAIIAISFFIIIFIGALLLILPRTYLPGTNYNFLDAFFTSTSAVCVTGLIVVDTATQFTTTGKLVILLLIQIGGLGIMTLTTFFAFFITGGMSLRARSLVKDLLSEESLIDIKNLLIRILTYTLVIELIGTLSLYIATVDNILVYEPEQLFFALFHSISAFCNAGFSLYSENLMKESIRDNYLYTSTIMMLIMLGGLGFVVHSNLTEYFLKKRMNKAFRLKIHTKLVLASTLGLILVGTLLIWSFESYRLFPELGLWERLYNSLFWSISARTAGFNLLPTEKLSNSAAMVLILLMWIGASPGSTGGGIKTTTISIVIMALISFMLGKDRTELFKREISRDSIRQSFFVILSSILVLGLSSTFLVWLEWNKSPLDLIFEATSAISTVGLSRNITYFMGDGAKILLIFLMFVGRVGVLSFLLSFHRPVEEAKYKFPQENIIVG